jgi:hypothetical protein
MEINTLLYCRHPKDAAGNWVFFETIRKAFPEETINVYSNQNSKEFDCVAMKKCQQVNANFLPIENEIKHSEFIASLITLSKKPFYVVDPDVIWFKKMPKSFTGAMAGRLIPDFYDTYTKSNTHKRIHTSVMWLDPEKIKELLTTVTWFQFDPISSCTYYLNGCLYRFDSLAKLYQFLVTKDSCYEFTKKENDGFAHLFCGTHLSVVGDEIEQLEATHKKAITDKKFAMSLYDQQVQYFNSTPWKI